MTFMFPAQLAPPTDFALRARPCLTVLLATQALSCVLRTYPMLDYSGGIAMAVMVLLGGFAMRQGMDIQLLCYYGLACAINGVYDAVAMANHIAKGREPLFSLGFSTMHNVDSAVIII